MFLQATSSSIISHFNYKFNPHFLVLESPPPPKKCVCVCVCVRYPLFLNNSRHFPLTVFFLILLSFQTPHTHIVLFLSLLVQHSAYDPSQLQFTSQYSVNEDLSDIFETMFCISIIITSVSHQMTYFYKITHLSVMLHKCLSNILYLPLHQLRSTSHSNIALLPFIISQY